LPLHVLAEVSVSCRFHDAIRRSRPSADADDNDNDNDSEWIVHDRRDSTTVARQGLWQWRRPSWCIDDHFRLRWNGSDLSFVADVPGQARRAGVMAEEIAEETEFHKFKRHVESNSVVEMVLKAHLIIEDTLMETLKFLLPHPGHVKPETMSFYDKVSLCGALGFISEYEVAALLTFNTLRNDTAHQLDTEISMADIQQVVNCFEPELRGKSQT